MTELARGGWTAKEILDALRGRGGSREIRFRFDVIRGGAKIEEVPASGSVSLNRFAEIQRTARFTLTKELDWLHDELKPYLLLRMKRAKPIPVQSCIDRDGLDWPFSRWDERDAMWTDLDSGLLRFEEYVEFPLGQFVLSSPARQSNDGANAWEVEAYDHTVILKEDSITEPLYFAAGTPYLDAVQSVLVSANVAGVLFQDLSDTVLPTDRVFDVGTSKLSIVNALLSELNFNSIRCEAEGRFVILKYKEPSPDRMDWTYAADELSVISRDTASESDFYSVPNVFIAVCSNPELEQDYRSVWINDSPVSALSTASRGRKITSEIYQPSVIPSQEALDAYIRRIGFEANQVYEQLSFTTALMPVHESGNTLAIRHPDVNGIFVESSWEMTLSAEGEMTHTARRLVTI